MGIERITNPYNKDSDVWANIEHDQARRTECLCRNCERKDDEPPYSSCPVAREIYKICVTHDMALSATRCGARDEGGELMYLPIAND